MTTAETLSRAARLLRQRAEAVPDHLAAAPQAAGNRLVWCDDDATAHCTALPDDATAAYYATIHPAVGLQLANWLGLQATVAGWAADRGYGDSSQTTAALTVARAVLTTELAPAGDAA